jgi:hypothetical protein
MTLPYTYTQVVGIVGDFANITYMGVQSDAVTLTGPDNVPGTTRAYSLLGANIVETLKVFQQPTNGPFVEIHALAPATVPSANVTASASFDGLVATPVCAGKATAMNLTTIFCATNLTTATSIFHTIHSNAVTTIGQFLGGKTFTDCNSV